MARRYLPRMLILCVICLFGLGAPTQAEELQQINYATVLTLEGDLPVLVAREAGYFADEGLDVNVVLLGGALTREALLSGSAKFGLLHVAALWPGVQKGLPLKFVSVYYTKEMFSVVVADRLKGEVDSIADLKGRRVMSFAPGGASYAAAKYYFRQADMDLDTDVQLVTTSTGDSRVWINALETGKVDALAAAWDPTVSTVVDRGLGFLLLDMRDPKVHERVIGGDAATLGVVAHERTISENPELVRKFQRALNRGLAHIKQTSAEDLAELVKPTGLVNLGSDTLVRTIAALKPNYQITGEPSRAAYERAVEMYVQAGYLNVPVPFEDAVSSSAR